MNSTFKKLVLSLPYIGGYHERYIQALRDRDRALQQLQQIDRDRTQIHAKLTSFEQLIADHRLIETEYPYTGCRRDWKGIESIEKLRGIIAANDKAYRQLVCKFASYENYLVTIPLHHNDSDPFSPNWINSWFPGLDAISLYGLLGSHNPRYYCEVGSGNSTKFARRAIRDLALRTKIISIDPCPRAEIDEISDRVIRKPLELMEPAFIDSLSADDILMVDSSHRSFPGSDVTVFFTEILTTLPGGIIYGMHDIFLPEDYPQAWNWRFFNEQYLFACYLLGGADGDEIVFPSRYVSQNSHLMESLDCIFKNPALSGVANHGGMCWMRKAQ